MLALSNAGKGHPATPDCREPLPFTYRGTALDIAFIGHPLISVMNQQEFFFYPQISLLALADLPMSLTVDTLVSPYTLSQDIKRISYCIKQK